LSDAFLGCHFVRMDNPPFLFKASFPIATGDEYCCQDTGSATHDKPLSQQSVVNRE